MAFKSGDSELFHWDGSDKRLYRLNVEKTNEHDNELESIDVMPSKHLFVTASREGVIKIWNAKKQLLREIGFSDNIKSVCFINSKADIAVGHSGQLSVICAKDYKPFETGVLTSTEIEDFIRENRG